MALRTMTLNQNVVLNNFSTMSSNNTPITAIIQNKRQIAPAKEQKSLHFNNVNNNAYKVTDIKYKKKYNYNGIQYPGHQTTSVARRNARERNRVKQVNNGFANLRQHIPSKVITSLSTAGRGGSKKLSKVDTLRLAVEYIKSLQRMLDENENKKNQKISQNLSLPCYSTTSQSSEVSTSPAHSVICELSANGGTPYNIRHHHFKMEPYDNYCEYQSESSSPSYTNNGYILTSTPHKKPNYEEFTSVAPEDEELLDTITWWQQQE